MRYLCLVALLTFLPHLLPADNQFPESRVVVRVVDQTGTPLSNAFVSASCFTNRSLVKGLTDTQGRFSYTDRVGHALCCFVTKPGYYDTHGEYWEGPTSLTDQPPTSFTIVLKKIMAPTPLLFKTIEGLYIPRLDEPTAFDLEVGDWVSPLGKGKIADVWMTAKYRQTAPKDYDISVTLVFSNSLNGIQSFTARPPESLYPTSDLMPPQEAPISGYTTSFLAFNNKRPQVPSQTSCVPDRNHIFRVRTRTNEANVIVSANVGWTVGDIQVGVGKNGKVGPMFSYYFNPDPTSRSLEPLDADKSKYR